jgi:hypothetical protein
MTLYAVMCACVGSGHRMFLISTKQLAPSGAPAGRAQEFVVLGATGNGKLLSLARTDRPYICAHLLA